MKRILALVLAISCILIVCGCGDNEDKDVSNVSGNPSAGSDENGQSNVTYKTFMTLRGHSV